MGFQISFSHLFLNSFSFSFNPNTFLTLKSPHPRDFRPTSSSNHLVSILNPFIYMHSCILDLVFRFLKTLGFLRYLWNGLCSFGAICSCVASSLQYSNVSCILELCDWLLLLSAVRFGLSFTHDAFKFSCHMFMHFSCICYFFLSYSELLSLSLSDRLHYGT